jgi:hypothetical protein
MNSSQPAERISSLVPTIPDPDRPLIAAFAGFLERFSRAKHEIGIDKQRLT